MEDYSSFRWVSKEQSGSKATHACSIITKKDWLTKSSYFCNQILSNKQKKLNPGIRVNTVRVSLRFVCLLICQSLLVKITASWKTAEVITWTQPFCGRVLFDEVLNHGGERAISLRGNRNKNGDTDLIFFRETFFALSSIDSLSTS